MIGALASNAISITPQLVVKVNFFGSGFAAFEGCATLPGVCALAVAFAHLTAAFAVGAVHVISDVAATIDATRIASFFTFAPVFTSTLDNSIDELNLNRLMRR